MSTRQITPSGKLRQKYYIYVVLGWAIFVFPWVFLGFVPEFGWTYVAIFTAINVVCLVPLLALIGPYCNSLHYELGEDAVVVRKGVITQTVETVPYRTVTNAAVHRGWLDRRMGLGTIAIHTAGYSQQSTAQAKLVGLTDHEGAYNLLLTRLAQFREPLAPTQGAEVASAGRLETPAVLGDILDEVRALRALLQARS